MAKRICKYERDEQRATRIISLHLLLVLHRGLILSYHFKCPITVKFNWRLLSSGRNAVTSRLLSFTEVIFYLSPVNHLAISLFILGPFEVIFYSSILDRDLSFHSLKCFVSGSFGLLKS